MSMVCGLPNCTQSDSESWEDPRPPGVNGRKGVEGSEPGSGSWWNVRPDHRDGFQCREVVANDVPCGTEGNAQLRNFARPVVCQVFDDPVSDLVASTLGLVISTADRHLAVRGASYVSQCSLPFNARGKCAGRPGCGGNKCRGMNPRAGRLVGCGIRSVR
jgi:hypothetical protein